MVKALAPGAEVSVDDRTHLSECAACREAVAIANVLINDIDPSDGPPTPDIVWFRARLRARVEASELAARPVLLAQAVAGASVVGAVAAVLGALGGLEVITLATRGLLLAFAVWLLIAPVAVYLAATED
jgi:hypothetical protein